MKAIFFDAGNTLLLLDYHVIATALSQEGLRLSPEAIRMAEYRARVKLDPLLSVQSTEGVDILKAYAGFILEEAGIPWGKAAERAFERIKAYNRQEGLWSIPNPEAPAVLEALKREGHLLGVVSNSDGSVERLLRQGGLLGFFHFVLDSHVVGIEKPDPRIFRLALERAQVEPEEAVHIGDFYSVDVLGAERAGLRGILLDPVRAWGQVGCLKARDLGQAREVIADLA